MALVKFPWHLSNLVYASANRLLQRRLPLPSHLQRENFHRKCLKRSLFTSSVFLERKVDSKKRLSPEEVTTILRQNETAKVFSKDQSSDLSPSISTPLCSVYSIDSNQLPANSPMEDKIASARCVFTTGLLFGVFDGHGGPECSQVVSKRLFEYIAACLLSRADLRDVVCSFQNGRKIDLVTNFQESSGAFVPALQRVYDQSLHEWCAHLLNECGHQEFSMEEALIGSFQRLDADLVAEMDTNTDASIEAILARVALSGAVACVAHIDGPHMHVANAGDCGAVLGIQTETAAAGIDWQFERMSKNHDWANPTEVQRILAGHPASEKDLLIQDQRLLGVLMPFRAFGDVKFKSHYGTSSALIPPFCGSAAVTEQCRTPPYLIATPEITYRLLEPQDKFVILGTDGLWEGMSVVDVVTLVGEHAFGRQSLQPVRLPRRTVTLGELSKLLDLRQKQLKVKPVDENAATHLIRYSIGGTDIGVDHHRICHSLTLPPHLTRYFRDDISIFVIGLNPEFLKRCPVEL